MNIEAFKKGLNQEIAKGRIATKTAKQYISAIQAIEEEMYMQGIETDYPTVKQIEKIITKLSSNADGTESESRVEKYMTAVKKYSKVVLNNPDAILYGPIKYDLYRRSEKYAQEPRFSSQTQKKKIAWVSDPTIRLALNVQRQCGVRLEELCNIRKCDVDIAHRKIFIARQKGGGAKNVYLIPNATFDAQLENYMQEKDDNAVLFPYENYYEKIITECHRLGVKNHDNRKLYIRDMYITQRDYWIGRGMGRVEAKQKALADTSRMVGHSNIEQTKFYLGNVWRKQIKREDRKIKRTMD